MSAPRSVGVYRGLLHLYPRSFRAEYGDDMALALTDLLRDEPPAQVWLRTASDLVRSVPHRHLEARMHRVGPSIAPIVLAAVAVAGLVLGVVAADAVGVAAFALVVAALAALAAVVLHRRDRRPLAAPPAVALCVTGAIGLAGTVACATLVDGELAEGVWASLMIVSLAGMLLIAVGLALGIAGRVAARRS